MIMIAQRVSIVSILLVDTVFAKNVKIVITTIEKEMVDPVPKGGLWSFQLADTKLALFVFKGKFDIL